MDVFQETQSNNNSFSQLRSVSLHFTCFEYRNTDLLLMHAVLHLRCSDGTLSSMTGHGCQK